MRGLVSKFSDKTVLISGRGQALEVSSLGPKYECNQPAADALSYFALDQVARSYGFQNVLSTYELGRSNPASTPFSSYGERCALLGPCRGSVGPLHSSSNHSVTINEETCHVYG